MSAAAFPSVPCKLITGRFRGRPWMDGPEQEKGERLPAGSWRSARSSRKVSCAVNGGAFRRFAAHFVSGVWKRLMMLFTQGIPFESLFKHQGALVVISFGISLRQSREFPRRFGGG